MEKQRNKEDNKKEERIMQDFNDFLYSKFNYDSLN